MNRKNFLKLTCGIIGATAVGKTFRKDSYAKDNINSDNYYGYLYDSTKCIGCGECTRACIHVNILPETIENPEDKLSNLLSDTFHREFDDTIYPEDLNTDNKKNVNPELPRERTLTDIKIFKGGLYFKQSCLHCLHPSCVSACPVGAMIKDPETGIVYNDPSKCIGCRYCMVACPFNNIKFEWNKNIPDARVVKCNFCINTSLKTKGTIACAEACPTKAILFGRRAELLKTARKRIKNKPGKYYDKIYGEKDGGGTSVLILAGMDFKTFGLPDLGSESPAEATEKIQSIYKWMILPAIIFGIISWFTSKNIKNNPKNSLSERKD